MNKDSVGYTFFISIAVCLVCSIFVAGSAIYLRPMQVANKAAEKKRNILNVVGLLPEDRSQLNAVFDQYITTKVVNLDSGQLNKEIDPVGYEQYKAARDNETGDKLDKQTDIAGIGYRADNALLYEVHRDGKLTQYILPVHGYGLWSTLYGFLALEPDGKTIAGLSFYQHAETPGLGGEVDNPKWKAQWPGKLAYGNQGNVQIELVKSGAAGNPHGVDSLSGATLTSRGVTNLLHFWLGENGFGPFIKRIQQGA